MTTDAVGRAGRMKPPRSLPSLSESHGCAFAGVLRYSFGMGRRKPDCLEGALSLGGEHVNDT